MVPQDFMIAGLRLPLHSRVALSIDAVDSVAEICVPDRVWLVHYASSAHQRRMQYSVLQWKMHMALRCMMLWHMMLMVYDRCNIHITPQQAVLNALHVLPCRRLSTGS